LSSLNSRRNVDHRLSFLPALDLAESTDGGLVADSSAKPRATGDLPRDDPFDLGKGSGDRDGVMVAGDALVTVRSVESDSLFVSLPRVGLVSLVGEVERLSSLSFLSEESSTAFSSPFQLPPASTDVARCSIVIDGERPFADRSRFGELSDGEDNRSGRVGVFRGSRVGVDGWGTASEGCRMAGTA
jgi:hypothetical protein